METLAVAATHPVATPPSSVDIVPCWAVDEPQVRRWPGWVRLMILASASAALWTLVGWTALRILQLG